MQKDPVPIDMRKSLMKKKILTVAERIKIAHEVICELACQKDVAKKYRVKPTCISKIITRASKNPKFLEELKSK